MILILVFCFMDADYIMNDVTMYEIQACTFAPEDKKEILMCTVCTTC